MSVINDQQPELLPCPFCGEPPTCQLIESGTVSAERSYTGQPIDVRIYKVACVNETCAVRPEVSGGLSGVEITWSTRWKS